MTCLTVAICTHNRAQRLSHLVSELRKQQCSGPFEILIINNNSVDDTEDVLRDLADKVGPKLRYVSEHRQGIVYARNRALEEAVSTDYLAFIDDDELPKPGLIEAAVNALEIEGADCAGGKVQVNFDDMVRPHWLGDDLLGFLAEVDHGNESFWVDSESTPVWTANVAYRMSVFREDNSLRFDARYNRAGKGPGGGEDVMMFREFLKRGLKIRYRPDMAVVHEVEPWRLRRRYFLRQHFLSGYVAALHELPKYPRTLVGVPPFLLTQAARQLFQALTMYGKRSPGALRQLMNFTHACGMIAGSFERNRTSTPSTTT